MFSGLTSPTPNRLLTGAAQRVGSGPGLFVDSWFSDDPQSQFGTASFRPSQYAPFNPETWIPFRLGQDAHVEIHIYSTAGDHVRKLDLGHKPAGVYENQSKAAYWDGRNEAGELVSSGVYFYQMRTDSFRAMKKLVVRK